MFAPKDKKEIVVPVRLDLDSPFSFQCDKDLACFTRCCKGATIMLTPGDIIRMKNRLGATSMEFISFYTTISEIENTQLPIPVLKMLETKGNPCPFLHDDGCVIYEDRPVTCRYYPIAAGIFHNVDESSDENFFALIKEAHCHGHGLGGEMSVREWRSNQGIDPYDDINRGWVEIILRRKSLGPFVTLPDATLKMFFMGCYDVDALRGFVFETKFLKTYEVDEERLEKMREDDFEMLKFGYDWLKTIFFGDGILKLREQVAQVEIE